MKPYEVKTRSASENVLCSRATSFNRRRQIIFSQYQEYRFITLISQQGSVRPKLLERTRITRTYTVFRINCEWAKREITRFIITNP